MYILMTICRIMANKTKKIGNPKSRTANYSKEEEDFLVSCMLPYKEKIENKRTNSVTNQAKDQAWESVANDFNASSPFGVSNLY